MNNPQQSNLTHQCLRRHICPSWLLPLLLLALPSVVQAQFTYTTNNGTIAITGYAGPGGAVAIPSTINGLPVTSIGDWAFYNGGRPQPYILTSVTIPDSVTSIGLYAFAWWGSLSSATLGNRLISIGEGAFADCALTTITIPSRVTSIGDIAFAYCGSLTGAYFQGNAPSADSSVFGGDNNIVYYLSGTAGWGATFGGRPTVALGPPPPPYTFNANNGTITITRYTGSGGAVIIPSTINGLSVTSIGDFTFFNCTNLTSVVIPRSITNIGDSSFSQCTSLTNITIPDGVTSVGFGAFLYCTNLTSVVIPRSVTSIGALSFGACISLTNVTIPDSVTSIADATFDSCYSLTSVTIPNSVTSIEDWAFRDCTNLTGVYFQGNSPGLGGSSVFSDDNNATVYYLSGTTGWGPTFGGRPTALWIPVPIIQTSPQTQTAEATSAVGLRVKASSPLPLFYFWHLNDTNLLSSGTNWQLDLPNVQFSQSGAYTVVISNVLGAVTSAPAMLQVIAPVERRPAPGVKVTGQTGGLLNVDYADSPIPGPNWTPLGSVSLISTPQYCFDVTMPLPPQRFYRAWQTGVAAVIPSLDLHMVPAITLTGSIGGSVRVDAINQLGPTDAWFTLDTVTLTNASQLYFDTSAWRQPPRLYRLFQVP